MLRREGGFTLIEILIVVLVLGIIAAIAIPKFVELREKKSKRGMNPLQEMNQTPVQNGRIETSIFLGKYELNKKYKVTINGEEKTVMIVEINE